MGAPSLDLEELAGVYLADAEVPIGPTLKAVLERVRERTQRGISDLEARLARLDAFEAEHEAELSGRSRFREGDPRHRSDRS